MDVPNAPVVRAIGLAFALAMAGGGTATPEKGALVRAAAANPSEAQLAAGEERLKAAAARLRTATHALDGQPGAAAARADMKNAIALLEASYEYLIGLFSKLDVGDHSKSLAVLQKELDELKKQKQALLGKMAASTKANEWRTSLPGFVALSDRALAAASAARPRILAPTPGR